VTHPLPQATREAWSSLDRVRKLAFEEIRLVNEEFLDGS
jgi:hypothetical protein